MTNQIINVSVTSGNVPYINRKYKDRLFRFIFNNKKDLLDLYSSRKLPLPLPQFIVFYNGTQSQPDRKLLYLSDCFQYPVNQQSQTVSLQQSESSQNQTDKYIIPAALECTALMLNINYGHNRVLMEKCKRLEEYAYFISSVRNYLSSGYEPVRAIQLATDECISQDKLTDILSKNRREVIDMLLTSFDEEKYKALVKKEAYEDGWEEGRKEGWEDCLRLTKTIQKLSRQGLSIEEIAAKTNVSLEQIHRILDEEPDSE